MIVKVYFRKETFDEDDEAYIVQCNKLPDIWMEPDKPHQGTVFMQEDDTDIHFPLLGIHEIRVNNDEDTETLQCITVNSLLYEKGEVKTLMDFLDTI